jgi:hypothetical protein
MEREARLARPQRAQAALLLLLTLAVGLGAAGLAAVPTATARPMQSTVLHEDFEASPLGPLGAPWSITKAGNSSASVVSTTDHGKALLLRGGSAADYLIASRGLTSSAGEIVATVDIKPASGASFVWSLSGAGSSIGRRRIRLQRQPGSTMLVSNTVPAGNRDCAALPSNAWSRVTLAVHAVTWPHTFDVRINGQPTACTGLETGLSQPFNGVSVMDASNEGWGGDVRFDNIDVASP